MRHQRNWVFWAFQDLATSTSISPPRPAAHVIIWRFHSTSVEQDVFGSMAPVPSHVEGPNGTMVSMIFVNAYGKLGYSSRRGSTTLASAGAEIRSQSNNKVLTNRGTLKHFRYMQGVADIGGH